MTDPFPFCLSLLTNYCPDVGNSTASSSCSPCVGTWSPTLSSGPKVAMSGDGNVSHPQNNSPSMELEGV